MKVEAEVAVTPRLLAEAFCDMNDEQQAQFFIEVAGIAGAWEAPYGGPGFQWWSVGRHLQTCSCSSEEARDLVREIARGVDAAPMPGEAP